MGGSYCVLCEANGCIACEMTGVIADPDESKDANLWTPVSPPAFIEPRDLQVVANPKGRPIDRILEGSRLYGQAVNAYTRLMLTRHPILSPYPNCAHKWAKRREVGPREITWSGPAPAGTWYACEWCGKWEIQASNASAAKPPQDPTPHPERKA